MKDLTIRDKIAIEAMNGILAAGKFTIGLECRNVREAQMSLICRRSYAIADAMLKEREKKEGE